MNPLVGYRTSELSRAFRMAICFFFLSSTLGLAQQTEPAWSAFRGTDGTGTATGHTFPTEIKKSDIAWETDIHGKGWSSPVVLDGKVWLTTATEDGKQMSVICVDLVTGKKRLDKVLHENESPDFSHPTNSYASPTPVVDQNHVYVHFGKYGTTCIDTSSFKVVWQRVDLPCDHFRGPGSSPILFENLLIVAFDGADQQYVVALDKATGKTVWKRDREINYGTTNGDFKKAYGTASVFLVKGKPLLVYPSAIATIAYHAKSGNTAWTVYHQGMNVSARPLKTAENNILITNGMGRMLAVDPTGEGDVTDSHTKWTVAKGVSRKPSPLVIGDKCYLINDKGVASCYRTSDGKVVWLQRIRGAYSSSPVFDGSSVFVCSEEGVITAFSAGDRFEQLGQTRMPDGFKATPALVGDRMILRSFRKLICVKGK